MLQVTFYLTGDPKVAAPRLLEQKPENVVLTGFLRGGNYTALLKNVHGLVVLTKVSDDLSCAAYEALAMAKPAVASEGPEMRRFFARGFIHVRNTAEDIADGIKEMLEEREMLTDEVIAQPAELEAARRTKFEEFTSLIKGEPI